VKSKRRFFATLSVLVVGAATVTKSLPARAESPPNISYTNAVVAKVPWSIQLVKVPRGNARYEIQSRHAHGGALGLETLSAQVAAARTERTEPVAAINGGFYLRDYGRPNPYSGYPRGLQIIDGEVTSSPSGAASLWIDYAGQPHAATVVSRFEITWPDGRKTPFGLNGPRADDAIELYTAAVGPSTRTAGGLELILETQPGGPRLPLRMERDYLAVVRGVHAGGNAPLSPTSLVLSIGPALMQEFQRVTPGATVRISTRSLPALLTARTAINGGPVLVREGRSQKIKSAPDDAYEFSSMLERHPRTAIGWNEQAFFLVQVDGRQRDLSVGMTLNELSDYLIKLGCAEALNLDGGGSSSLWFEGKVRNSPCDGYERKIANSLLVVQKNANAGAKRLTSPSTAAPPERGRQNGN